MSTTFHPASPTHHPKFGEILDFVDDAVVAHVNMGAGTAGRVLAAAGIDGEGMCGQADIEAFAGALRDLAKTLDEGGDRLFSVRVIELRAMATAGAEVGATHVTWG